MKTPYEQRVYLWEEHIKKIPKGEVKPSFLKEMRIYRGQAGIYRDGTDMAMSILNTARETYPNYVFDGGLLYSYPDTNRKGSFDKNEIDSVKECWKMSTPLFVILPGNDYKTREVKLGLVKKWDDDGQCFLISLYDSFEDFPD